MCLCFVMHYFLSIIVLQSSLRGRERWLLCYLLSYRCIVTKNVLLLFLTVPRVGLQCVIVVSSHIVTVETPETSKPPYSYLYRKIGPNSIETS